MNLHGRGRGSWMPGMNTCTASAPRRCTAMMAWEQQHPGCLQNHEVNAVAFSAIRAGVAQVLLLSVALSPPVMVVIDFNKAWTGKRGLNSVYSWGKKERGEFIPHVYLVHLCTLHAGVRTQHAELFHRGNLQNKVKHLDACSNSRFVMCKVKSEQFGNIWTEPNVCLA